MSPEQAADSKHVDLRTDIYALGEILNDISGRMMNLAPTQLCRIADKAKAYNRDERYFSIAEFMRDIEAGYNIWIKKNASITSSAMIDEIDHGKIEAIELLSYVEQILRNPYYAIGDADRLSAALTENQYMILETSDEELCFELFEHLWDDWRNTWNNDFNRVDDMTSLVNWYWGLSRSSRIKGYNLAMLAEAAYDGNRFAAMDSMVRMISEISGDEQTKKEMLRNTSVYTIKSNYKKIGKNPPPWL